MLRLNSCFCVTQTSPFYASFVRLAVICEKRATAAFTSIFPMNCDAVRAARREMTNHSAGHLSDLITETTIPLCDNLMTVLQPGHIKSSAFNHRRLLRTSVAQGGTIVWWLQRDESRSNYTLPHSLSMLLYYLALCGLDSLCFCPSHWNILSCPPFIAAPHHRPSSGSNFSPPFALFIVHSAIISVHVVCKTNIFIIWSSQENKGFPHIHSLHS